MRESSFDTVQAPSAIPSPGLSGRGDLPDRLGAWLVALSAFLCYYQGGSPASDSNAESSWMQTVSHAFAAGWQWGTDIVYTYGPLGFLTPYMTWSAEVGANFRAGQLLLCALWAFVVFGFARGLGAIRQVLLIVAFVAWYPLLGFDIGWNVPFVVAVILIHRWGASAELGRPRKELLLATIALLSLLALVKFTGQIMWTGVVGYGVLMAWARRDVRLAIAFGIGAPLTLALLWLAAGQSLAGFPHYVATSLQMSFGYGAMSLTPAARIDELGFVGLAVLAMTIITLWNRRDRVPSLLTSTALAVIGLLVWKAGYVRPDGHVAIFFGSASFISLAVLCMPAATDRRRRATRWFAAAIISGVGLWISYGMLHFHWQAPSPAVALNVLFNPGDRARANRVQWEAQAAELDMPRTRQRIGVKSVDVLMNEQAVALLNHFNFKPRPAFQGYAAYTTDLTRLNESHLLNRAVAPEFLLVKLQSIDNRYPAGDDPLSVLAALRAYRPVDREGGYLVMQASNEAAQPVAVPEAAAWKVASLGADLDINQGAAPQALFFDIQLNFWGRLRGALLREPGISMQVRLSDGTEHSYALVRRLGQAGMLVSPFMLTDADYVRWSAGISERRVVSMQIRATDPSDVRWFNPVFAYSMRSMELPRYPVATLSPELKQFLYPHFSPAPTDVETSHQEVMNENGEEVLFVHAPATLTFTPDPGVWTVSGKFGLISTAYSCQVSDGVALIAERLSSDGTVTNLLARAIDPVHKTEDRGPQNFEIPSLSVEPGDRILLRSAPGLSASSASDCDWSYFSGINFAKAPTR